MEVKAPLQSIAEQQAAAACEDRGTEEACCEAGIVIAERLCVSVDLGDSEPAALSPGGGAWMSWRPNGDAQVSGKMSGS